MALDIRHLFRHAAGKFGLETAVENGGRQITYGELRGRIDRLTRRLWAAGVSKGDIAGIFSEDTLDFVEGILAVLGAGGIFCPLDASFPQGRLEVMLSTVPPRFLLANEKFLGKLDGVLGRFPARPQVIPLEDDALAGAVNEPEVELCDFDPNAGCSIYFTSGSTGRPKAIVGRLKGIDHFARWEAEALGVGPGTRVSQLASPCFDGYLKDVFVPLCAGGVVCAPERRKVVQEAGRLIDWVDVEGIEVLHCVPSVLRSMLNEGLEEQYFGALRWVVLAGEAVAPADVRRWKEVFGERIGLVNLYGPTETAITKLFYFVQPGDEQRPSIPIGKPMPGADVLVVNSQGRLCKPGWVGEIYIRTPYRALGYYGEAERTAEVFVRNPFSEDAGDLIYKTGDYGRLLEDGNLEYLGRRDQQVKVRGVRVELGEIENLLRECGEVKDVAVVDREDAGGTKYLCAYVVLEPGAGSGKLREHLASYLPEYMLPGGFVEMQELPRTLNGKIDRKALPSLQEARQAGRRGEGAGSGRTAVEEIVAGIWAEVLRLEEVGGEENFFELGGHSLLATQIISRVREALQVDLPLRVLFEAPTVGQLSRRIESEIGKGGQKQEQAIPVADRSGALPLSYAQQRMWLLEQLSQGSSAFNMPMGLRMRGRLQVAALEQTLGEIVRRHEVLRARFVLREGEPVQEVQPASVLRLAVADLSGLAAGERELQTRALAEREAARPFALSSGLLVRLALVRLSGEEHVLLCTMHHLGGDAWSFEVLQREMSHLYGRFSEGAPSRLAPLAIQYGDYAVWQRQWLQGERLEARQAYWKKRLQGAPEELRLPQKRRRGAVQSFQGARQGVEIAEDLAEQLRKLSRREGVTLYMTMLSAFVVLLYQYTGELDLVVGSVIANREREQVEPLIGFLANTIVLRVELPAGGSFREVLARVRETCLEAYAHQLPPEKLAAGEARGKALFDVWFQMERAGREKLQLGPLDWEAYPVERPSARFELSLILVERDHAIAGELEYDAGMYSDNSIRKMSTHLTKILEAMAGDTEADFGCVPLSSEEESEQMRYAFSADLS